MWTWAIRGGCAIAGILTGIGATHLVRHYRRRPSVEQMYAAIDVLQQGLEDIEAPAAQARQALGK